MVWQSHPLPNTLEDGSGCGHLNSSFILVEYPSSPSQARSTHPDDLQPHEEEVDHDHTNSFVISMIMLIRSQGSPVLRVLTVLLFSTFFAFSWFFLFSVFPAFSCSLYYHGSLRSEYHCRIERLVLRSTHSWPWDLYLCFWALPFASSCETACSMLWFIHVIMSVNTHLRRRIFMAVLHNAAEQIPDRLATRPPVRETVAKRLNTGILQSTLTSRISKFCACARIQFKTVYSRAAGSVL